MTRILIQEYEKWGLKAKMNETKYMAIGDLHQDLILGEDMGKISYTEEYKYLGMRIMASSKQD